MCKVSPENIELLRVFGLVFLIGGIVSLLSGVTYYRGLIRKEDEPVSYWINTIGIIVLGGGALIGIKVCV